MPLAGTPGDKAMGVDSNMVTSFRVFPDLPIRAQWIARITEFGWHHFFAGQQDGYPFKSWHHRHEFAAETRAGVAGTLVSDGIDCEVGFSVIGPICCRRSLPTEPRH
jgi:ligand-binding SRPBCC domain-containing protein